MSSHRIDFALDERPSCKAYNGEFIRFCEPKQDGHRTTIIKGSSSGQGISAFGRKKENDLWPMLKQHTAIVDALKGVPDGSILDGELVAVSRNASDVPTALRAGEGLMFFPFALPRWGYDNSSMWDMRDIYKILRELDFPHGEPTLIPEGPLTEERKKNLLQQAVQQQIEGWVLKAAHYQCWYKLKPIREVDAFVTGFRMGEGLNAFKVGAVALSVYNEEGKPQDIGVCKLQSKEDRLPWERRGEFLNRVVEVHYDSMTVHKRLRFAQFQRWRDDKTPQECHIEQLNSLNVLS